MEDSVFLIFKDSREYGWHIYYLEKAIQEADGPLQWEIEEEEWQGGGYVMFCRKQSLWVRGVKRISDEKYKIVRNSEKILIKDFSQEVFLRSGELVWYYQDLFVANESKDLPQDVRRA